MPGCWRHWLSGTVQPSSQTQSKRHPIGSLAEITFPIDHAITLPAVEAKQASVTALELRIHLSRISSVGAKLLGPQGPGKKFTGSGEESSE